MSEAENNMKKNIEKSNLSSGLTMIQGMMAGAISNGDNVQLLSDGYHTFNELYAYRLAYNALLFNEWANDRKNTPVSGPTPGQAGFKTEIVPKYDVHKSKCHSDGKPCFDGTYFVVVAILPTGQISNHYKLKYWDMFKIPEEPKAKYEYDGHTSEQALERMNNLLM